MSSKRHIFAFFFFSPGVFKPLQEPDGTLDRARLSRALIQRRAQLVAISHRQVADENATAGWAMRFAQSQGAGNDGLAGPQSHTATIEAGEVETLR